MHLVQISDIEIYDLETGTLFDYEFKSNVSYNGEPGHYISRKNADSDTYSPVADGYAAQRLWAYLESLLKFDATKAQDAPDNFATPKVGDKVYRPAKNNRVIEGKITELAQSDNGFMVTWEGQSVALFETVHSVSWIPF